MTCEDEGHGSSVVVLCTRTETWLIIYNTKGKCYDIIIYYIILLLRIVECGVWVAYCICSKRSVVIGSQEELQITKRTVADLIGVRASV